MNSLEHAKTMTKEEVLNKIASSELPECGVYGQPVFQRWQQVLDLRKEDTAVSQAMEELTVVAALNNADTDGIFLELLKEHTDKVLEGINIAAYGLGASKCILQLPSYAEELATQIKEQAMAANVEVLVDLVNVRANKYNIVSHIVTMLDLAELFEDCYKPGAYISVNGHSCKKYSYEKTIGEVLADAGADLSEAKAFQVGYRICSEAVLDKTVKEANVANGVCTVLTTRECMILETEKRILVSRQQSCGKCVFCREGLLQLHGMLHDITEGKGKQNYTDIIKEIGSAMTFSTPCSMGQESSKYALDTVELFGKEYEDHIKKKTCAAQICFSKTVTYIDPQLCEGCGECVDVCPEDCIEGKNKFIHMIDEFDCTQCGKCIEVCEYDAILQTAGKLPKLPNKLTKCGKFKKH